MAENASRVRGSGLHNTRHLTVDDRRLLSLRSAVIVGIAVAIGYSSGSVMALLVAAMLLHTLIE